MASIFNDISKPIIIDGNIGEGGGQMLRLGLSLSALYIIPVKFINIRIKRKVPGLSAQHLEVVRMFQRFGGKLADLEGDDIYIGTTSFTYIPPVQLEIENDFEINIGTAGSLTLLLQAILPVLISKDEPIKLTLIGGTDVSFSPPLNFFTDVLSKYISRMGINVDTHIIHRGFYPRGGGKIVVNINPTTNLRGITIVPYEEIIVKTVIVTKSNLSFESKQLLEDSTKEYSDIVESHNSSMYKKEKKMTCCVQTTGIPSNPDGNIVSYNFLEQSSLGQPIDSWHKQLTTKFQPYKVVDEHSADQLLIFSVFTFIRTNQPSSFTCFKQMSSMHFSTSINIIKSILPYFPINIVESEEYLIVKLGE